MWQGSPDVSPGRGFFRSEWQQELLDVRHRIADRQRIEAALAGLVDRGVARRGKVTCPLIASLLEAR